MVRDSNPSAVLVPSGTCTRQSGLYCPASSNVLLATVGRRVGQEVKEIETKRGPQMANTASILKDSVLTFAVGAYRQGRRSGSWLDTS